MTPDPATNDRSRARFDALMASLDRVPLARLPNIAWVEFITGPLSPEDWALIGRVERGEMSVDQAMQERVS